MQNKNIVIVAIIALVGGVMIGYCSQWYFNTQPASYPADEVAGMHMMPDGTMMNNAGNNSNSMSGMMMDMNAALRGKTGDAFDQAFLAEMIVHHQGAVDMAQLALTNAKHQEIKDLAKAIIAAQNKEIADMKAWQKNWYNQ